MGYEGFYEISNFARVRRLCGGRGTRAGRLLNPSKKGDNRYVSVSLSKNGEGEIAKLHILVLEAFHGLRPSPDHEGNHLFGSDRNCEWELEWTTKSGNQEHKCHVLGLTVREYEFVSPQGKLIRVKGLRKFCREQSLDVGNMAALGKRLQSYKGWRIAA